MATRSFPNLLCVRPRQTGPPLDSGAARSGHSDAHASGDLRSTRGGAAQRPARSFAAAAAGPHLRPPPLDLGRAIAPVVVTTRPRFHKTSVQAVPRIVRRWRARWAPRATAPWTAPVTAAAHTLAAAP